MEKGADQFWGGGSGFWVDPCSCENLCSVASLSCFYSQHWRLVVWIFGYTGFLIVWDMVWFSFLAFFLQGRRWSVRDRIQSHVECQNANLLFSICPFPYLLPSQPQVSGFTQRSHLLTTSYLPAAFRKRDLQLFLLISSICSQWILSCGGKSPPLSLSFNSAQSLLSSYAEPSQSHRLEVSGISYALIHLYFNQ